MASGWLTKNQKKLIDGLTFWRCMPTHREILRKCFTEAEWIWLMEEEGFVNSAKSVKTADDVENVSRQGSNLITLAQLGKHPSRGKPPREAPRL
jgi:hypothetical protein